MHKVIERKKLIPNIHQMRVSAPEVARKVKAGNFVIIKADETAERIPLTVADWDVKTGELIIVFQTVGASTHKLAKLNAGDEVQTVVGPLGRPQEVKKFGTVACVMGCYGMGAMFPVARAMKKAGNKVIALLEGRSKDLLFWSDRYEKIADKVVYATDDGIDGHAHRSVDALEKLIRSRKQKIDRVVVLGCTFMMMRASETTRPKKIKTIVSLNPVMIDGTGMCGVCRCSVAGKTQFACVDGPDFDGHEVDWKELMYRRRSYLDEETRALSEWECKQVQLTT